jgi:acetyltransferase-like isoleucine patch superfamily enzyme
MGVTINLGVKIGKGARIGNGATVKADVPENGIVKAGTIWPKQGTD